MSEETIKSAVKKEINTEYKERVMGVLMDAPLNKLSHKELVWAASNLPDNKLKGVENTSTSKFASVDFSGIKVDHKPDQIYDCFGITEDDLKGFAKMMKKGVEFQAAQPEGEQQNSKTIEYIMEKLGGNPKFVISLIIKTMNDAATGSSVMDRLSLDGLLDDKSEKSGEGMIAHLALLSLLKRLRDIGGDKDK